MEEVVIDPFISPYPTVNTSLDPVVNLSSDESRETLPEDTRQNDVMDFAQQMDAIERTLLEEALAKSGHNQRLTAQNLGLSYDQVRGLVRKHGLGGRRRRR